MVFVRSLSNMFFELENHFRCKEMKSTIFHNNHQMRHYNLF